MRGRRIAALAAAVVALVLVATGYGLTRRESHPPASSAASGRWQLADLEHGGDRSLVSLFNEEAGTPRLVLLVSPT